jgi:TnpA family transposase
MPRRTVLTDRQRAALFDLPQDEATLTRFYTLSEDEIAVVRRRRRPRNRIGFALQLCAFRYPGRLLQPGELIPGRMLSFIAAQLGLSGDAVVEYAKCTTTRYQHSAELQKHFGYRPFAGAARQEMANWLLDEAEEARSNHALAAACLAEFRKRRIIVPAPSSIERLCAEALVEAERRIARRIADRLDNTTKRRLDTLLSEQVDGRVSRFVWLRQASAGSNPATMNQLLDRLEILRALRLSSGILTSVPAHRVSRLSQEGERLYADALRELPTERRLSILVACVIEWQAALADAVIETHERILGRLYRQAERRRDELVRHERHSVAETLRCFAAVGTALIEARHSGGDPFIALEGVTPWGEFESVVESARCLTGKIDSDPLDFLPDGYARLRRYTPRFLESFAFQGSKAAGELLAAIDVLGRMNAAGARQVPDDAPTGFVRGKWRQRVLTEDGINRRSWELCLLFELKNALRSGDVWVEESRRYRSMEHDLLLGTYHSHVRPAGGALRCRELACRTAERAPPPARRGRHRHAPGRTARRAPRQRSAAPVAVAERGTERGWRARRRALRHDAPDPDYRPGRRSRWLGPVHRRVHPSAHRRAAEGPESRPHRGPRRRCQSRPAPHGGCLPRLFVLGAAAGRRLACPGGNLQPRPC